MRLLKKTLFILIFTFFLIVSGISLFVYFNTDNIKKLFINYLNNNLSVLLYVKNIDISYWETFPDVSVKFSSVVILSSNTFNKKEFTINTDTLFKAKTVLVSFNVFKLLKKIYVINGIEIKNSEIHLFFDKKGNTNFQIVRHDTSKPEVVKVNLNKIKFINTLLCLHNNAIPMELVLYSNNFKLSGNFYESDFTLKTIGNLSVKKFIINKQNYLKTKTTNLKLIANVINKELDIKKGEIYIDDLKFIIKGKYVIKANNDFINIDLQAHNLDIKKILTIANEKIKKNLERYKADGICTFNLRINGYVGKNLLPTISSEFQIINGSLVSKKDDFFLTNINLLGSLNIFEKQKLDLAYLKIDTFYAYFNDSLIIANGVIKNFNYPQVNLKLNGFISLENYQKLFNLEDFEFIKGDAFFSLFIDGKYRSLLDIKPEEIEKSNIKGKVILKNVSYKYKDSDYIVSDINSTFEIKNNTAHTNSLTFKVYNTEFYIKGTFDNVLTYLFNDNSKLFAHININIPTFDIKNFTSEDSSSVVYNFGFPEDIDITGNLTINNFYYDNLKITDINSEVKTFSGSVCFNNTEMKLLEGKAKGNFFYNYHEGKHFIKFYGELKNVNVKKLFSSLNNFGQQYITDKNINGTINSVINLCIMEYDSLLNLIENSLFADVEFLIKNGQLINFEPLYKLADYISLDEIRNIKFSDITNNIFIKDRKILIPNMEIKSNAFNIEVSGEHSFDNDIDYHIRLFLKEWLGVKARNRKKENQEYGIVENDGLGSTSLYLNIKGTTNNYKISYDSKKMKEQIKESIKNEKVEIKTILKSEFGLFKKDTSIKENIKSNLKYKIEWDE